MSIDFESFSLLLALALLVLYIIFDALFAWYTLCVTNLKPLKASIASFFIFAIGAFGILNYVENALYIIPVALGGFLGTYLIVEIEKRKKVKKKDE